ncbi:MAG TPA: Gfo/Idh/MocA family oxidoreductase [bacterium]|nr:Gfo/Idh/MocA family oxidoreductase [bacterium]
MSIKRKISRRRFFQSMAALSAPALVPGSAWSRGNSVLPNDRITLGFIGVGKQGYYLLRNFLQHSQSRIVAVCDVDALKLSRAKRTVDEFYAAAGSANGCSAYSDYRELLQRSDIDAVVIATPDHWHALQAIQAMRLGKDVYGEKPLSLTIGQARQMADEARRWGRVFQTGSMQRSDDRFRHACELVQNGYIGQVKHVRVSVATGFKNHPIDCDLPAEKIPAELDWNLWLGPAPYRPYNAILAPPISFDGFPSWRDYYDYSGGGMTDWGAHHFDIAQWGLGMDHSGPVEIIPPDGKEFKYLTYRYATGTLMTADFDGNVITFTGTEGMVEVNRDYLKTQPAHLAAVRIGVHEKHSARSSDHAANWLDCMRTRNRPVTDVEIGCRSVIVCHLGNIAVQLNHRLHWDPVAGRFAEEDANRLIVRAMRSPWVI